MTESGRLRRKTAFKSDSKSVCHNPVMGIARTINVTHLYLSLLSEKIVFLLQLRQNPAWLPAFEPTTYFDQAILSGTHVYLKIPLKMLINYSPPRLAVASRITSIYIKYNFCNPKTCTIQPFSMIVETSYLAAKLLLISTLY